MPAGHVGFPVIGGTIWTRRGALIGHFGPLRRALAAQSACKAPTTVGAALLLSTCTIMHGLVSRVSTAVPVVSVYRLNAYD